MTRSTATLLLFFLVFQISAQIDSEADENLRAKNKISERLTYEIDLKTNDSLLVGYARAS